MNGYIATAVVALDPVTSTYSLEIGIETVDGTAVRISERFGTPSTAGPIVQLGAVGTRLFAIYGDNAGAATLTLATIDTSSPTTRLSGWGTIGTVATDHSAATGQYQLVAQSLTDRVAFAYVNDSAGTSRVTVKTVDNTGVLQTATINTSSVRPNVIGLEGSIADTLWVAWNETTSVKLTGLTGNALATVKATTATIVTLNGIYFFGGDRGDLHIVSSGTAGQGRIAVNDGTIDRSQYRTFTTTAGAAVATGTQVTLSNVRILQRPFRQSATRYYGLFTPSSLTPAVTPSTPTGYAILCDWTDIFSANAQYLRPVANIFPAISVLTPAQVHTWVPSTAEATIAMSAKSSAVGNAVHLVTLDFTDPTRWQSAVHNGTVALSGGILSYPDGARLPEYAFLYPPPAPIGTPFGVGTLTGSYRYVQTWEHIDSNADLTISSVSAPSAAITAASHLNIQVPVYSASITNRVVAKTDSAVRRVLYRTDATGLAPYYYVADFPNDTSAAVTYSDATSDTTLRANRLLYGTGNLPGTNGSAQDRRAPPYSNCVVSYNGMLVSSSGADVYWSSQPVSGEAVWFNPAFSLRMPDKVTAMAAQDGALYIFSKRAIYSVAGEIPSDNGAQGGLGTPRLLASDVGCTNGNGVAVTSAGIVFQSSRGIELLNRGGAVQWIGEPVQDTLATYPFITSAVRDDRQDLVRFTCTTAIASGRASGDGRTLIFDLTLSAWVSEDDLRGTSLHQSAQDGAMVTVGGETRYAWLATDGTVYLERLANASDAYLDGTSFIVPQIELPLWKLGLQQEQRVYEYTLLFERYSAAGITVEFSHDFDGYVGAEPDKSWTESQTNKRQLPFRPKPRGSAIGMRIRATEPAVLGTGRGFSFVGISSDIAPVQGPTRGTSRLPTADRR
ncbi:MAG: hypothetical protein ACRCU1_11570 [Alsobacter sp.]